MLRKILLSILFVLLYTLIITAQSYTISGYVTDATTGEALINANVYEAQSYKGTVTNEYGFYSLTLPTGSLTLQSTYVGYQTYKQTISLKSDTIININLQIEALDEIIVTAPKEGEGLLQESTRMSTVNLPMQQIESVPALFGERDVLKALSYTPGVSTGMQGSSSLLVRGGTPDQNLILLDGATVYNVNHFFGFMSVFNTDALKNVELIKGGFPARYGGRLSSVLDISMKEGNTEKIEGEAGIGIISSRFTINGPINKRTSFLLSGRSAYLGLLGLPVLNAYNRGTASSYTNYSLYDINAKINHRFNDKNKLFLSFYTGRDFFVVKDRTSDEFHSNLNWGNITGTLRYNRMFTPKLFGKFSLNYTQYKYHFSTIELLNDRENSGYNSTAFVRDGAATINFDFLPIPTHYIKFGISGTRHFYQPSLFQFRNEDMDEYQVGHHFTTFANEGAAYFEDDITITRWWKSNIGFRFAAFHVDNQWYTSPEPRISTRFLLGDWALKGSYSYMKQYIHLLTNLSLEFPADIWIPTTSVVPPQSAEQFALGLSKTFPKQYTDVSIEAYYKTMHNLITFEPGGNLFLDVDERWEEAVTTGGNGEAYGLELFIHRKKGRFNGWLAYTLSWNTRQFENINQGRVYAADYDSRHDFSFIFNYRLSSKLTFSSVWGYRTGQPITLPTATHLQGYEGTEDQFFIETHPFKNNERLSDIHRLDISLSLNNTTKRSRKSTWNFSIYNVYNQVNPIYSQLGTKYVYNEENEIVDSYKTLRRVGYIPIMPSVSYSLEF